MKRKFTEIRVGKHHIHYAWVVLFSCCMFFGASMGIYSNCSGLYTADMLGELGWSLTLITVLGFGNTVTRLYGSRIAPKLFKKYSMKTVMAVAVIVLMLGGMSKSLVKELQQYISANYYNCTDAILASLGEMYVGDSRFKGNIDRVGGEGTAQFAADAIKEYLK